MQTAFEVAKTIIFNPQPRPRWLIDDSCNTFGLVGQARMWLADCIASGAPAPAEDHRHLLGELAALATRASNADFERAVRGLEHAGFQLGYNRQDQRVSLAHRTGYTINARLRAAQPVSQEYPNTLAAGRWMPAK